MIPGSATLADIVSADWSIMLDGSAAQIGLPGGIGNVVQGVADINQCVMIILSTPRGSDPLRPTFGADLWQYVDYPLTLAVPSLVREITQALTIWEPRLKVLSISVTPVSNDPTANAPAHLDITVTWQLVLPRQSPTPAQLQAETTTISISGAFTS
jgi:uncharacterized protein